MFLELFEKRASPENPRTSLSDPASWLWDAFGASKNASGVSVNERSAMKLSAVFACVRVLAESVGSLPIGFYERIGENGKRSAREHYLYNLLRSKPNPEMNAITFKETLQAHAVSWGGGFAEIQFNGRGEPVALWPLMPDVTRVERINGRKWVITSLPDGQKVALPSEKVLHVPGLGFDGLNGYSVVRLAAQSIGLALATEEYGAAFFGRGAKPSGVLEHPGKPGPETVTKLREAFTEIHGGLSNAHRVAILTDGMKFNSISVPNEDAQFLETRKFQVSDIARWFRVPPHMIGDLERSTNNNIEHQGMEFVTHTLQPWLVRWEQAINGTLLLPSQSMKYFAEFNMDAMLRGDSAARGEFYTKLFQIGALSQNDIRAKENENPIDGGDKYFVPLNMLPTDMVEDFHKKPEPKPEAPKEPEPEPEEPRSLSAIEKILATAADRVVRRQVKAVRNAMKKDALQARIAIDEFFEREADMVASEVGPYMEACAEALGRSINADAIRAIAEFEASHAASNVRACLKNPETAQADVDSLMETWSTRAQRWAREQVEQLTMEKAA